MEGLVPALVQVRMDIQHIVWGVHCPGGWIHRRHHMDCTTKASRYGWAAHLWHTRLLTDEDDTCDASQALVGAQDRASMQGLLQCLVPHPAHET